MYLGVFLGGITICLVVMCVIINNSIKSKKYKHFVEFCTLPFTPNERQIIYIEREYNAEVNGFIQENYDSICEYFRLYGYEFCYLPYAPEKLSGAKRLNYWAPYRMGTHKVDITSDYLLQFMSQTSRESVKPSLIYYSYDIPREDWPDKSIVFKKLEIDLTQGADRGFCDLFNAFELSARLKFRRVNELCDDDFEVNDKDADYTDARYEVEPVTPLLPVVQKPQNDDNGARYSLKDNHEMYDYVMAEYSDSETLKLLEEIDARVARLAQKGINEHILQQIVAKPAVVSRMVITSDNRIILPDYNNMEIKMSPLVKAVYFLFLYHPEGIVFKRLSEYREELIDIYENIKGEEINAVMMRSVEDVTDPTNNSINEKIARIREAFVTRFDERLAVNYIVRGERGEPKRIPLHREFVEWQ